MSRKIVVQPVYIKMDDGTYKKINAIGESASDEHINELIDAKLGAVEPLVDAILEGL